MSSWRVFIKAVVIAVLILASLSSFALTMSALCSEMEGYPGTEEISFLSTLEFGGEFSAFLLLTVIFLPCFCRHNDNILIIYNTNFISSIYVKYATHRIQNTKNECLEPQETTVTQRWI